MKLIKKAIIGSALALAFSAAQATTVGGVSWNPDYSSLSEKDFLAQFDFTQWFGTQQGSVGGTPQVADAVAIGAVFSSLDFSGPSGSINAANFDPTGYYLKGVGEIYRVNGQSGASFCPNCELTYAFGGIGLNKNQTFDVSNAWARMYVNSLTPNYSHPLDDQAEANDATSGSTWLDFQFTSLGFISGNVQDGKVSAVLKIIGGDAQGNFQPSTLTYTAGAFFEPDTSYSSGGNGALKGNSIPEPGSLALFGLGLLGAAGAVRRRKA